MIVPEYFKEKTKANFGDKGEKWISELPEIISLCMKKWDLYNLSPAKELSINLVYLAKSDKYGDVVLKLEGPHPEKYTEMKTLELFNGGRMCSLYDSDIDKGALLLERIYPGTDLTNITNPNEQLRIAIDLIYDIPKKISAEEEKHFPTYFDWIKRAFRIARSENKVGDKMFFYIDKAEEMFEGLNPKSEAKVLLHGDVHHWNILKGENEDWKVIDPQGVIGYPFLESARFMDNHMNFIKGKDKHKALDEMIEAFSAKFNERKRTIAIGFFVLEVLSTCWTFEEANPSKESLQKGEDDCTFVYEYLRFI